jgi:hypothetical protein
MSCIKGLLGNLCPEVEAGLEPHLKDFFEGLVIRAGLPQNWVFKTEKDIVTLHVSKEGKARVRDGGVENPDVIIEWSHDNLASVLTTRSSGGIPPGEAPNYTARTAKGQIGFNLLKKYLRL